MTRNGLSMGTQTNLRTINHKSKTELPSNSNGKIENGPLYEVAHK